MASQPYFFYSNKCSNCSQVIETLKALNKAGLYKFILVESLPRNQIPSFLKKVPTLYIPETKEVIVGKTEIFAQIAKPTNARKELPTKQQGVSSGGASEQIIGDISAWGFEGTGSLTEHYSDWNAPNSFTAVGGSMYTFLNDGVASSPSSAGVPSSGGVSSENTIKSKTGSNDDVAVRMAAMEEQRKKEFGTVSRN